MFKKLKIFTIVISLMFYSINLAIGNPFSSRRGSYDLAKVAEKHENTGALPNSNLGEKPNQQLLGSNKILKLKDKSADFVKNTMLPTLSKLDKKVEKLGNSMVTKAKEINDKFVDIKNDIKERLKNTKASFLKSEPSRLNKILEVRNAPIEKSWLSSEMAKNKFSQEKDITTIQINSIEDVKALTAKVIKDVDESKKTMIPIAQLKIDDFIKNTNNQSDISNALLARYELSRKNKFITLLQDKIELTPNNYLDSNLPLEGQAFTNFNLYMSSNVGLGQVNPLLVDRFFTNRINSLLDAKNNNLDKNQKDILNEAKTINGLKVFSKYISSDEMVDQYKFAKDENLQKVIQNDMNFTLNYAKDTYFNDPLFNKENFLEAFEKINKKTPELLKEFISNNDATLQKLFSENIMDGKQRYEAVKNNVLNTSFAVSNSSSAKKTPPPVAPKPIKKSQGGIPVAPPLPDFLTQFSESKSQSQSTSALSSSSSNSELKSSTKQTPIASTKNDRAANGSIQKNNLMSELASTLKQRRIPPAVPPKPSRNLKNSFNQEVQV